MLSDLRLAWRALAARPALAATALATFVVGIGATTAMYSVVDGVLLRPLPFNQPDRIVRLFEEHPGSGSTERRRWMSSATLDAWLPRTPAVAAIARYGAGLDTVGRERPERLATSTITASLFDVVGARPLLGRPFSQDDEQDGAHRVVILSHALWQSRFGGESAAVGQTLVVNGEPHEIVGVMPESFAFPTRDQVFWRPIVARPQARDGRQFRVEYAIARLADGATAEQAAQEGTVIARAQTRPMAADLLFGKGGPVRVHALPLAEEMTATVRPALLVASAGVAMVLLLACANVANLFLSRGVSRQRELAVRAALGASRGRLMRQALAEGLLLSVTGGVLGMALAWGLLRIFPAVAPAGFPRLDEVRLHWRVLLVSLAVSLAAGALAALAPAWRASRASAASLHDGDRRSTGAAAGRMRGALLIAEAALAVMLLVGAALLGRSLMRLMQVDGGFEPAGVLTAELVFPAGANTAADVMPRVDAVLEAVRALPGVTAAGSGNMGPLSPTSALQAFTFPDAGPDGQKVTARVLSWGVTPGYLEAMGLRLKAGRFLQPSDVGAATQAFLVNEEFVRQYWHDGKPVVGRQYSGLINTRGSPAEVVGVVGNVLKDGLDRAPQPEIFVPVGTADRTLSAQVVLGVRTGGSPDALAPSIRQIVARVDERVALDKMSTLSSKLAASVATPRFAAALMGGFAGLAMLLAAIGLYGVLSYTVSARRREMGVRAALGASRGRIVSMVMGEGLRVVMLGLAIGLIGAAALSRFMEAALFGVTPLDAWAYLAAPLVLMTVAVVACLVPATRASRVDPAEALRCE